MIKLVCEHDPHDPDHMVCGAKWSRIDIALLVGALVLVAGSLIFLVQRKTEAPAEARLNLPSEEVNSGEGLQYSGQSDLSRAESRDLYLESEALYFSKEGEQIGRGPWPLEAGKETKIKVFLKFVTRSPGAGDLVTITGKLASNVKWTGFVPIGQGISYEPETRTVRWKPTKLSFVESLQSLAFDTAVFEVSVTPTYTQTQEEHLVIMNTMAILVRNTSGNVIAKVLTPDLLLFFK